MIRAGLGQIASSMRHRKTAWLSLVLEVALGCTVVAYVLALGAALRDVAREPIGLDQERTFTVAFEQPPQGSTATRRQRELAELRALPGVTAAAWVELPPLSRRELPEQVMTPGGPRLIWTLQGDEHVLEALGVTPSEGRGLTAEDVHARGPRPVVVTRAFAHALGPEPLGATLAASGLGALTVVGVIEAPIRVAPFYASEVAIVAGLPSVARRTNYLVRTEQTQAGGFAATARAALAASSERWVHVERLSRTREQYLRNLAGADTMILITVLGMLAVVLVGSLGMASSLVVERARQIGIRRALGARKSDIAAYFMLENLLATALGLVIGAGLCAVLDVVLRPIKGELSIDWAAYMKIAAALFLTSGQLAVFWPARRAARIAPSVASRTRA